MTTLTKVSVAASSAARSAASSSARSSGSSAAPVPHDFPYLTCAGCGFPVPPGDLVGDEYRHWHASTRLGHTGKPAPAALTRSVGVAAPGADGATAAAADRSGGWLGWVACLPCRHSASRVRSIPFGDGRKRPPLTPSLWRHGGWQVGQARPARATGHPHERTPVMRSQPQNRRQTRTPTRPQSTHELYLHAVRDLVVSWAAQRAAIGVEQADRLAHAKLLYGVGDGTYRGVTVFNAWHHGTDPAHTVGTAASSGQAGQTETSGAGRVDIVEVAATGQESWVQLAGTVIHELAHVLAGHAAGHDTQWKDAAVALGFTKRPAAAGQVYHLSMIEPTVRHAVYDLARRIGDGRPEFQATLLPTAPGTGMVPRPCSAGVGTRGGVSRGKGSGSRLRLWECACTPKPVKVRLASDDFRATCDRCHAAFTRADQPHRSDEPGELVALVAVGGDWR
jgi:hypothetical protein